jgi:hypothetical protein
MTKTLNFLLSLLFVVPVLTYAQKKEVPELKVKFGKISEEEIAMKQYDKDPDAAAVVLFDIGYSSPVQQSKTTSVRITNGAYNRSTGMNREEVTTGTQKNGKFERHLRLKIFKKEAYNRANFDILYSKKADQSISDLKAVCYNYENGKLVEAKVTKENIHEETLSKRYNVQKITFPNVRVGSIIEIKYTIINPSLQDWYFQDEIPAIWSEFELSVPDIFNISQIGQGFTPYILNTKESISGTTTYHWIQKDVPAIKSEKFMNSVEDYKTKMTFFAESFNQFGNDVKLVKSWNEEAKEFMEDVDFGDFINKKSAFKDELANIIKGNMKPIDKIEAIYSYLGKNYEVANYWSLYITETIKTLKEKKKLSPTELNLFFITMLKAEGIEVAPVLIRTTDKGSVATDKAILSRYNRVISRVILEKDTFYTDITGYPQPLKLLPINALSNYGIAFLGEDKYEEVVPFNKLNTRRFPQVNLALNTEGVLSGDINISYYGYDAFNIRKDLKEKNAETCSQTILKELLADGKLENHKYENTESHSDAPLKSAFKIKTSAYVNKSDDKMYINPFLSFGEKENPFKADERKYEVNFPSTRDEFYQLTLTLPEGYKVEELPKTARIQMPDGSMKFEYLIAVKENIITVNTKFNIKRATFFADEYVDIKQLYAKILTKMGEQIVLSKITK